MTVILLLGRAALPRADPAAACRCSTCISFAFIVAQPRRSACFMSTLVRTPGPGHAARASSSCCPTSCSPASCFRARRCRSPPSGSGSFCRSPTISTSARHPAQVGGHRVSLETDTHSPRIFRAADRDQREAFLQDHRVGPEQGVSLPGSRSCLRCGRWPRRRRRRKPSRSASSPRRSGEPALWVPPRAAPGKVVRLWQVDRHVLGQPERSMVSCVTKPIAWIAMPGKPSPSRERRSGGARPRTH